MCLILYLRPKNATIGPLECGDQVIHLILAHILLLWILWSLDLSWGYFPELLTFRVLLSQENQPVTCGKLVILERGMSKFVFAGILTYSGSKFALTVHIHFASTILWGLGVTGSHITWPQSQGITLQWRQNNEVHMITGSTLSA